MNHTGDAIEECGMPVLGLVLLVLAAVAGAGLASLGWMAFR